MHHLAHLLSFKTNFISNWISFSCCYLRFYLNCNIKSKNKSIDIKSCCEALKIAQTAFYESIQTNERNIREFLLYFIISFYLNEPIHETNKRREIITKQIVITELIDIKRILAISAFFHASENHYSVNGENGPKKSFNFFHFYFFINSAQFCLRFRRIEKVELHTKMLEKL